MYQYTPAKDFKELTERVDSLEGLLVGMLEGTIAHQEKQRKEAGNPRVPQSQVLNAVITKKLEMVMADRKREWKRNDKIYLDNELALHFKKRNLPNELLLE